MRVWQIPYKKNIVWRGIFQVLLASFIIAAGWNWYHAPYRPHGRFVFISMLTWAVIFVGYYLGKRLYSICVVRFDRDVFWQADFVSMLDRLFLQLSLFFLIFFSRNQMLSVLLFLVMIIVLFYTTQRYLSAHPNSGAWKQVNQRFFYLILFLFSFFATVQYLAFRMANFDAFIKFHNIVLFRAWAMTMFLILGFVISVIAYAQTKKPWRLIVLILWAMFFGAVTMVWGINIVIMYFSGLYLNPLMVAVAQGSASVSFNWLTGVVGVGALGVLGIFGWLLRSTIAVLRTGGMRQWLYYCVLLIPLSIGSVVGLSSFQNTPEYTIARNFYNYIFDQKINTELSPVIQEKLKKFGLQYNVDEFYLARKEKIFSQTSGMMHAKPNIIIIFFESFSSRLTSVYNQHLPALTPGLEHMAAETSTIVFKNFYNASTPTINGIIAELCSFLPPTGYTEIEVDKNLQRLRLLCLPTILKQNGYASATYITAVKKEFENKDSIFASMDADNIYGQDELKKIITGEPLSWGYSDHQLYPAMWQLVQAQKQEPFLMMLSTVDTHPPFDLAKDMVSYQDGKNNVLNSYHTADDAFGAWWQKFKASSYYDNTMVIAVADHAAFPGSEIKKIAGLEGKNLNFYDENLLLMYLPAKLLTNSGFTAKTVDAYSSGIDLAPTLLHLLDINTANSFEGYSIFEDRKKFPNILGMHEYGLYINQMLGGGRDVQYEIPSELKCDKEPATISTSSPLTLCEYLDFYKWKRQIFEQGRFWGK